jgi:hypothetical protein
MSIHDDWLSLYGFNAVDDDEKEKEGAATRPKFFYLLYENKDCYLYQTIIQKNKNIIHKM